MGVSYRWGGSKSGRWGYRQESRALAVRPLLTESLLCARHSPNAAHSLRARVGPALGDADSTKANTKNDHRENTGS